MKKYNQLADLEALLLDIPNSSIRDYVKESIDCYFIGSYRASIVSIWIAIVYDLYQKIRYLAEQYNDSAAKECIGEIDAIRSNPNKKQVTAWEREILDKAHEKIKMITELEYKHLNRIQEDRHSCAHPVLDSEGLLFQPSPELARTHIRTAIDILLSQPAIMGKTSIEALVRDVEKTYFPDDIYGVTIILKHRHLVNSDKYIYNIFLFTLKKILFLDEIDDKLIKRYILVFVSLHKERPQLFQEIDTEKIIQLLERTKEERFCYFYDLLYSHGIKDIWNNASSSLQQKFITYINEEYIKIKKDQGGVLALVIFIWSKKLSESEFVTSILEEYTKIDGKNKNIFLKKCSEFGILNLSNDLTQKIIEINIEIFTKSCSYPEAKQNANNLIVTLEYLTEELIDQLLNKLVENQRLRSNQLDWFEDFFIEIFNSTFHKYPQTLKEWQWFIDQDVYKRWENLKEKIGQVVTT